MLHERPVRNSNGRRADGPHRGGRYPGFHVLEQRRHWDDATRDVVLDRMYNVPEFQHFQGQARKTLEALCECVIPQAHLPADQRVPLAPWIDAKSISQSPEGFRFDDMPPNRQAWDWGLEGLDQTSHAMFGTAFANLSSERQGDVLQAVLRGDPPGDVWRRMPAQRWWIYVALRQIIGIYYAHPFAWDEIGFGGPAYPRGYFALNAGAREPWEVDEVPEDGRRQP